MWFKLSTVLMTIYNTTVHKIRIIVLYVTSVHAIRKSTPTGHNDGMNNTNR